MAHPVPAFLSLPSLLLCAALGFSTAALAEPTTLPLHTADSGTLYVEGRLIGKVDTTLLLDTGSGYVSLSRAIFNRVKGDAGTRFLRDIHGVLADGNNVVVPVYSVAELRLGANCTLREVEVAVMPNGARDILGLNALRQLQPLTLQLDPPRLTANCAQDSPSLPLARRVIRVDSRGIARVG